MPALDIFAAVSEASRQNGLSVLVIGGHAVNAYGFTRTTLDADFLICLDDLPAWRAAFEDFGWRWIGQTLVFAKFMPPETDPPSLPADIMLVNRDTFEKVREKHRQLAFGTALLPVPQPLYLIALKLPAMKNDERLRSGRDLADILQIIRLEKIDTEGLDYKNVVERYANESTRSLLNVALGND